MEYCDSPWCDDELGRQLGSCRARQVHAGLNCKNIPAMVISTVLPTVLGGLICAAAISTPGDWAWSAIGRTA